MQYVSVMQTNMLFASVGVLDWLFLVWWSLLRSVLSVVPQNVTELESGEKEPYVSCPPTHTPQNETTADRIIEMRGLFSF